MKKLSFILVFLSFFAFVSLNSCQQKPKETNQTEEEMAPAEEDTTPANMQEDTTQMSGDTSMQAK